MDRTQNKIFPNSISCRILQLEHRRLCIAEYNWNSSQKEVQWFNIQTGCTIKLPRILTNFDEYIVFLSWKFDIKCIKKICCFCYLLYYTIFIWTYLYTITDADLRNMRHLSPGINLSKTTNLISSQERMSHRHLCQGRSVPMQHCPTKGISLRHLCLGMNVCRTTSPSWSQE